MRRLYRFLRHDFDLTLVCLWIGLWIWILYQNATTTTTMSTSSVSDGAGNSVVLRNHQGFVAFLDDTAYYGLMVYVFNATGLNSLFFPLPEYLANDPWVKQALRYGLMFATIEELRRWLVFWHIPVDISHLLTWIGSRFQ